MIQQITPLPAPPQPSDSPIEFDQKAFALLGGLPQFVDQANALGGQIFTIGEDATESAAAALVSKNAAATSASNSAGSANASGQSASNSASSANAANQSRIDAQNAADAAADSAHSVDTAYLLNRANHTGTQQVSTIADLGSAATKNAQTSVIDASIGALLQVGAFGLGKSYDFRGQAFNGNLPPNAYYGKGTLVGLADGGNSAVIGTLFIPGLAPYTYGVLTIHGHHSDATAAAALQRWFFTRDRFFVSVAQDASTWSTWRELLHSGNIGSASVNYAASAGSASSAASASKLATPRLIAGVAFDGTGDITLPLLGQYQSWQSVSRAANTTYYNTTGRPIVVNVSCNGSNVTTEIVATVSGVAFRIGGESSTGTPRIAGSFIVPVGAAYGFSHTGLTLNAVHELR